jgi:hypothetical protein
MTFSVAPTGTVTFLDGATTLGTGTLNVSRVATFTTSSLAGGPAHSITARYNGDVSFAAAASNLISQKVMIPTTTSVVSSLNPALPGQSVTFTATVAGTGGPPTGTVTFFDGGTSLGTSTLNGSGMATVTTSLLAAGSHAITASYGGDANFNSSSAPQITQVVLRPTTTALVSSPNPSTVAQSVTFTATVSSSAGTPTGSVTFFEGGTSLGTGTLSGGVATFSLSSLALGSHSITASYGGDANFSGSTSPTFTHAVVPGKPSTTALISSLNPSVAGQPVTFTAMVSGAGGPPTGTATFLDGATSLGTLPLIAGVATFTTSSLAAGTHAITARFDGDTNFAISTSALVSQMINAKPTTTTLVLSVNPSAAGQSVTFTATVGGAGGPPTGAVTFFDSSTTLGTGTLSAGVASFTTSSLAAGSHPITARYGGDATFAVSTSSPVIQSVAGFAPANTATVVAGQSVSIGLTVFGSSGTFTLSCVGAPLKSSCAFNPNPVIPVLGGTQVQLMFSTASSRLPARPSDRNPWPWQTLEISTVLAALIAMGIIKLAIAPRRQAFGVCLAVIFFAVVLTGCGSGSSSDITPPYTGTPKGPATFTVTGTSGTTTLSTQVTVTVQ